MIPECLVRISVSLAASRLVVIQRRVIERTVRGNRSPLHFTLTQFCVPRRQNQTVSGVNIVKRAGGKHFDVQSTVSSQEGAGLELSGKVTPRLFYPVTKGEHTSRSNSFMSVMKWV